MINFPSNLKKIREARRISRAAIAERLDISQPAYAYYEQGRRQPDLEKLIAIAEILKVSTDELLGHEIQPLDYVTARLAECNISLRYIDKPEIVELSKGKDTFAGFVNISPDQFCQIVKDVLADYDKTYKEQKSEYIRAGLIAACGEYTKQQIKDVFYTSIENRPPLIETMTEEEKAELAKRFRPFAQFIKDLRETGELSPKDTNHTPTP